MSEIAFPAPDREILKRRDAIVAGLRRVLPKDCVIDKLDERRAFETDALTAYRQVPLAVVLPRSTEEVAAVMAYLNAQGVPVTPRGAGTSLSGGAIPQEDSVVLCLAKMSRVLEVDFANRVARVEAGVTNLAISDAVAHEGFFYAPDPSSQLACSIGGNIGMNSGGAHCLKYGVTTNNLLGVRLVLVDGTIVDLGGAALDAPGYDLLALVCGAEGQLGIVTEATVRILRAAEGARPVLFGFPSSEEAGAAVAAIIGSGIIPVAMEFMDAPAIKICEDFAHAGYPLDVEAMLIIEVEGSEAEMEAELEKIIAIARQHGVERDQGEQIRDGDGAHLEGPQISLRGHGSRRRLHLHGRHGADRPALLRAAPHFRDRGGLRPARRQCLPCGRRQYASLDPLRRQRRAGAAQGRGRGIGHPQALRRGRRLPHGRARRRHREARSDGLPVLEARPRAADARAPSLRSGLAA